MPRMSFFEPQSRRKYLAGLASAFVLALIAVGAMAANGWLPRPAFVSMVETMSEIAVPVSASETEPTPVAAPTTVPPERITAELVVITPRGFEPNVIRRAGGLMIFALTKQDVFSTASVVLRRENGEAMRAFEMPRTRRRSNAFVTLTPGRYQLVDTRRPEFVCDIEITNER